MKKKQKILCIILLLLAGVSISAQSTDKTVQSIIKRHEEIAEKARLCEANDDQGEYGELVMNELKINSRGHQWRAVGIYGQTFKFFYKGVENDERRLYPDQLVFVKTERRSSNRVYHEELLYSDTGTLMFYSQRAENDELSPADRRVYFSGTRAVRIIEDGKSRDKLTAADIAVVKEISSNSSKVLQAFKLSIGL